MEIPRRVPNNVSLAGLRRLLKAAKERAGAMAAVNVVLEMWHFPHKEGVLKENEIQERIGVYDDRTGTGTEFFTSLKEAHDYIKTLEKGGD